MANTSKRKRRLWDTYAFPGFHPKPTVRGVFGDPKARVVTLTRRSKNQFAAAVVARILAGTTGSGDERAICPVATPLTAAARLINTTLIVASFMVNLR